MHISLLNVGFILSHEGINVLEIFLLLYLDLSEAGRISFLIESYPFNTEAITTKPIQVF